MGSLAPNANALNDHMARDLLALLETAITSHGLLLATRGMSVQSLQGLPVLCIRPSLCNINTPTQQKAKNSQTHPENALPGSIPHP
jgi:hypothetical protein